jgi:hypothetical protein
MTEHEIKSACIHELKMLYTDVRVQYNKTAHVREKIAYDNVLDAINDRISELGEY